MRLTSGPFRKEAHKITGSKDDPRVNGKRAIGTNGGLPNEEFYTFEITVDGKRWRIPKRLWGDCYDPNLKIGKSKTLRVTVSPDGEKLAMGMYGSDGAGAYYVIWYLRADGRHSSDFRSTEEAWKWSG